MGAFKQKGPQRRRLVHARAFTASFMDPSVDDQKHENHETGNQQNNGQGLILPNRMEVFRDLIEIHANLTYTDWG